MTKIVKNAEITSTFLGREEHGILTSYIIVRGEGFSVSIGGYVLDTFDEIQNKRVATSQGFELIDRILKTIGVSSWEDLVGKFIRIETDGPGSRVTKIGNVIKDEWFDFEEFFKEVGNEKKKRV